MGENIVFRVPGRYKDSSEAASKETAGHPFPRATTLAEIEIAVAARGTSADLQSVALEADPDANVVELEFEGGIRQFVHPVQLRDDVRADQLARGGEASGVITLPTQFGPATSRGAGGLVLTGLRLLGVDPVKATADVAVRKVISSFEEKLSPAPGLYRIKDPNTVTSLIGDTKQLDASGPYLLFLHGTASSISGSFGGLAPVEAGTPPPDWAELAEKYKDRVLALQHKTFSESPIKNAMDVVALLPEGARLHLVSHSRGGLIGELLSMTGLQDWHFRAFENAANERLDDVDRNAKQRILEQRLEEAANIRRLAELIKTKRLTVEKFVRVACPARGTILLSRRLDLYLSVVLNVIGFIPGLDKSIIYDFLKATVLEVVKRRTDPRELPGIEAMMPESPLVHILNQQSMQSQADLAVISGDLAPEGLWKKLALLAVQVLYLEDNDLVVNTMSMYGGMQRAGKAYYFFNKGPHVNHFHYFKNPGTQSRLRDWLVSPAGTKVEGFSEFLSGQKEFQADPRRAADTAGPILFLVPDQLGSRLSLDGTIVWPSSAELSQRGLGVLTDKLAASDLVPEYYADLHNSLSTSYEVRRFPFDWRGSLLDAAAKLAEEVKKALDEGTEIEPNATAAGTDAKRSAGRRVVIVGHGTGGTIALLLAREKDLWAKFTERGGRVVMLGSPIRKSGFAGTLLKRTNRLNRYLSFIGRQAGPPPEQLFRGFPGIIQVVDPETLRSGETPHSEALRQALEFELPPNVFYIAGKDAQTPFRISRDDDSVRYSTAGDGHVTWDEPRNLGIPSWLLEVPHGRLADPAAALPAIRDLLASGTTDWLARLPGTPPIEDGGVPNDAPVLYPQDNDLVDAALGGNTQKQMQAPEPPLKVWVSHGHLRHAKDPIVIGHYIDDSIVSAEKVLDRALGGRLTQRFGMGIYPGPDGSAEVVITPNSKPRGALVIGLGAVGELTQEKVRRAVTNAVLRYALAVTEKGCALAVDPSDLGISALLVGAYGELTTRESVAAILKGVLEANRLLRSKQLLENPLRISSLEFVDLYEDIAIEAAHELLTLAERFAADGTPDQAVTVDETVHTLEGGQTSRPRNQYQAGWWRRVSIDGEKDNETLRFTVLTDRAQTSDAIQGTQRELVESLLQDAVSSVVYDRQLSGALFQLLVPPNLQGIAADRVNLVLVVDRKSARYPWELLAQRSRNEFEPLATTCGLLRQFRSLKPEHRKSPAFGMAALVIGDTMSGLPQLPGARQEAALVSPKLAGFGYDVTALPADVVGRRLVTELLSRDYRVIHIAAHGEVDAEHPDKSGVVIGRNIRLSPNELKAMTSAPDLAFINCCYLGQVPAGSSDPKAGAYPDPELASGFAETLMAIGTRAVVVAGWAVDDSAGRVFAESFYDAMCAGKSFGEAVKEGRQRTQALYPERNTWGAYQCYGNPDFRLKQPTDPPAPSKPRYVSRLEILQRIQDIAASIDGGQNEDEKNGFRLQLKNLREHTPVEWRDGEVLGAIGKAYMALGDYDRAIESYVQALTDEKSSARIKLIQDLGNLLERTARSRKGSDRDQALDRAISLLETLAKIIDTAELSAVIGAFYKRKGQYAQLGKEKTAGYKHAFERYERAFHKRKAIGDLEMYYPGVNAAALAYVSQLGAEDARRVADAGKWKAVLQDCVAAATERCQHTSDFWARVTPADALLVEALWNDQLVAREQNVIAAYEDVVKGGGQAQEFNSMLGQLEFLASATANPTRATLEHMLEVLKALTPRDSGA